MPVQIAKEIHRPFRSINGWIQVLVDELGGNSNYELTILFPINKKEKSIQGRAENVVYYSFFQNVKKPEKYQAEQEVFFEHILEKVRPDLVHIWGSEYPHTLAMVKACEKKEMLHQTVISIQGLISVYAKHYYAGLPSKVVFAKTMRDFIKCDGIQEAKRKFEIRGRYEQEALKKVKHVIGRTEWDLACIKMLNPGVIYHYGNEILRQKFYEGEWRLEKCQKHSIFMSQWGYPIKGLHMLLEAFKNVITEYPDAKLITTGKNPFEVKGKEKIKQTYYYRYLMRLIEEWGLKEHIVFLGGELKEDEMRKQYLKAHVFVMPSAIENSPNSMGEAMLLGTPVVASNVGGVSSMLIHEKEGFLYPFDEPYMMAYYIKCIFKNDDLARKLSCGGRTRAIQTHHIMENVDNYYRIYDSITSRKGEKNNDGASDNLCI